MKNFIIFLCLGFLFSSCTKAEMSKAPDFALEDIGGKVVKLSDYAGKVIILNFWATTCPPCLEEIPDFVKFYNSYCEKGVVIIGIAVGSYKEDVKKLAKKQQITYPLCISNREVENLYAIRFTPTTFIIDRKGNIHQKKLGAMSESGLIKIVENLL